MAWRHLLRRGLWTASQNQIQFLAVDISSTTSDTALAKIANHYRQAFGWVTEVHNTVLQIRLSAGLAAFLVRPKDLVKVSQYIESAGDPFVALRLPARGQPVAVLVDARDHVTHLAPIPTGLTALPLNSALAIPPSQLTEGRVQWLSRPDEARRWLPNAATLLAAVHALRHTTPLGRTRRVEPRDRVLMEREEYA